MMAEYIFCHHQLISTIKFIKEMSGQILSMRLEQTEV